jgi:Domain of unknown function (DUF222)
MTTTIVRDTGGPPVLDDLDQMDARQLAELFATLDRERRRVEHALARVVGAVEQRQHHRADGHRSASAWCRALGRWSGPECRDAGRVARLVAAVEVVDRAMAAGDIGVAQVRELARAFANPRCGHRLVEVAGLFVEHARHLSYDDFVLVVRRWEMLADADGAHREAEEAHRDRRAGLAVVGVECHLTGRWGAAQGAVIESVLARFEQAEFDADWEATVRQHGDAACALLMPRTAAQRRADAVVAIFERAADAPATGTAAVPLVNLVVDVHTVREALGQPGSAPVDPRRRRCETADGRLVPPGDVLAAMWWGRVRRVVVDDAGVVVDLGRARRLFTGSARDAVKLQATHCVAAGCEVPIHRCEADHVVPWSEGGPTGQRNGAPLCGHHNRWKSSGYRVWRDCSGYWHTSRPDGSEIG